MTKLSILKQEEELLSKEQETFNKLIKKIDRQKTLLRKWQELVPLYHERYLNERLPKENTLASLQEQMLRLLDSVYHNKIFGKTDQAKIRGIIYSWISALMTEENQEDLKALYNKYSPIDFDAEERQENELMKSTLEEFLGVDLGDDVDVNSPESIMSHVEAQLKKHREENTETNKTQSSKGKRSPKLLEKETRQREEEAQLTQSLRDVYLKLVRISHPDGEKDETAFGRKTERMQRINVAYKEKDLFTLLELQQETEQNDQASLNGTGDSRLKNYNKLLNQQLRQLQDKIHAVKYAFSMQFDTPSLYNPKDALWFLDFSLRELDRKIQLIQRDLNSFANLTNLKKWLKEL